MKINYTNKNEINIASNYTYINIIVLSFIKIMFTYRLYYV